MQKLTRLETITQERKEKEKARKDYLRQSMQFSKRLWYIPTIIKLLLLTGLCTVFYYLGMLDTPPQTICDEKRDFIIYLPPTGAE